MKYTSQNKNSNRDMFGRPINRANTWSERKATNDRKKVRAKLRNEFIPRKDYNDNDNVG